MCAPTAAPHSTTVSARALKCCAKGFRRLRARMHSAASCTAEMIHMLSPTAHQLQCAPELFALARAWLIRLFAACAGWVSKVDGHSCVVCPYHGWAFDAEGKVRDVPASENKVRSPD